jgi:hypothetical protein
VGSSRYVCLYLTSAIVVAIEIFSWLRQGSRGGKVMVSFECRFLSL